MGAMISALMLRNELEGWNVSNHELVRALLTAETTELLALLGRNEAEKLLQEQLVKIDELAREREHIMDSA
jgi:hypothetical protein